VSGALTMVYASVGYHVGTLIYYDVFVDSLNSHLHLLNFILANIRVSTENHHGKQKAYCCSGPVNRRKAASTSRLRRRGDIRYHYCNSIPSTHSQSRSSNLRKES
jgi:hypothetical protein